MIKILTEPKNALTKQYQKLFELDHCTLEFQPDALEAIAQEAMRRNTGARGLRAIVEDIMMDVMYDIPSRDDISKVIVTKEMVLSKEEPLLVTTEKKKKKKKEEKA